MSDEERELIQMVLEDILFIQKSWNRRCDSPIIRHGSVILRRLLIEGIYNRAWHLAGLHGHPNISAPRIDDLGSDKDIWWAIAGGGTTHDLSIQRYTARFMGNGVVSIRSSATTFGHPFMTCPEGVNESIPLKEYLTSTSVILSGAAISRHEVINFMANKAGGVHLDTVDKTPSQAILRAKRKFLTIQNHDGLSFELLSIGQCMAWSPDTQLFVRTAQAGPISKGTPP